MAVPDTELRHAPPFLLAAGLLVWGWQTGYMPYAVIMATLLEAANWIRWRWNIEDRGFNQITDLCSVIFFVVTVYVFMKLSAQGIFTILALLPFLFYLLVLTQTYSVRGKIKLSSLFISLRRLEPDIAGDAISDIDITLPYFLVCMVSASAGNQYPQVFFIILCVLTGWLLWSVRPGRYHPGPWVILLCLAFGLAYTSQAGIQQLQKIVETTFLDMFDQFAWTSRDPDSTITAIGSVGRLKLSDRIMLRVKPHGQLKTPMLLREATYNSYGYGIWNNSDIHFFVIDPDLINRQWVMDNGTESTGKLTISTYLADARGIVAVPHGANAITRGTEILQVENSPLGSVRIESRPGWINYDVIYNETTIPDAEPFAEDLIIQAPYVEDFKKLVSELKLDTKNDDEIIQTVEKFFRDNFYYSLVQNQRYPRGKFLSRFLFEERKGHCEYFATATALLLRAAGIPARYAVGYSIEEYSPWEGQYIARARHAHAWVVYYSNQRWHTLDTTPSVWAPLEAEDASFLVPILDLWSWLKYSLSDARAGETEEGTSTSLLWFLLPLFAFLGWRLYKNQRIDTRTTGNRQDIFYCERMGLDSGFFRLIQVLEKREDPRRTGETLANWIHRIQLGHTDNRLKRAIMLHNRYRFDPENRNDFDKRELDTLVQSILDSKL